MRNKKADLAVTLLVFMAVVMAGAASLIFLTSSGKIEVKIVDARYLDVVYIKEAQINFYTNEILEKAIKDFKIEDGEGKLVENFRTELQRYKINNIYVVPELEQVEEQLGTGLKLDAENKKATIDFKIKILEQEEKPFAIVYNYEKIIEKAV